ncbi:unnamed protein product [Schistosoma turkestanicum]|nr:unnamed protein product [Schistosoma turkestanicum]
MKSIYKLFSRSSVHCFRGLSNGFLYGDEILVPSKALGTKNQRKHQVKINTHFKENVSLCNTKRTSYPELDENDSKIKDIILQKQASPLYIGSEKQKSCKYPAIILEGSKLISDALATGAKAKSLFFSSQGVLQQVGDLNNVLNVYYVNHRLMRQLSSLQSPPGVIALFELPEQDSFREKNMKGRLPVTLILDRISDPGNMGSLIRSGASFGLDSILVTKGSVNIWNDKVIRAGMSGHFRIPVHHGLSWTDISRYFGISDGSSSRVTVFVADPEPLMTDKLIESAWKKEHIDHQSQSISECKMSVECEAVDFLTPESTDLAYRLPVQTVPHFAINYVPSDYDSAKHDCRLAIVLGSEAHGVSPEAYHLTHLTGGSRLVIPSADDVNSLNVLSAASVLLGEIQRQFLCS